VVGQNTRLILRTDAVPFRVLVDGPDGTKAGPGSEEQRPQGAPHEVPQGPPPGASQGSAVPEPRP
jgi:hypothetical protein